MKSHIICACAVAFAVGCVQARAAAAQGAARQFGVSVSGGVTGAPLGEVAESYGTRALAGGEYGVRVVARSVRGNEWSVGVLTDRYRMRHVIDLATASHFNYSSSAVVVARGWRERAHGASLLLGLDVGWRVFAATSERPDVYTGELRSSHVRGSAALLGVSYGIELTEGTLGVAPRVRLETSYPDFGGGDGYSALHRERDLGFRASVGVELRRYFSRR